jgi:hypothetical protein
VVTDSEAGVQTPIAAEPARRGSATLITDARMGTSEEMSARIRQYTITMSIRAACFLSMIFVQLIAVMAANQVNRHFRRRKMTHGLPTERLGLTTGHDDESSSAEVIEEDEVTSQRPNERVA